MSKAIAMDPMKRVHNYLSQGHKLTTRQIRRIDKERKRVLIKKRPFKTTKTPWKKHASMLEAINRVLDQARERKSA